MSYIKTKGDIEQILKGGKILGEILEALAKAVKPGVTSLEIDRLAEKLIKYIIRKKIYKIMPLNTFLALIIPRFIASFFWGDIRVKRYLLGYLCPGNYRQNIPAEKDK